MNDTINKEIAIINKEIYEYPSKESFFSPAQMYPEYPFEKASIVEKDNMVYEMIREGFIALQLDKENINTPAWNPLGEFIKPGDYVLLKPNMVLDENHIKENGTECLITHPSIVRAVLDYVVIALRNTGHIVVGDAPLQSCDFDKLIHEQGYDLLVDFYHKRGITIELKDFRLVKSQVKNGIIDILEQKKEDDCTVVNLENISEQKNDDFEKLRVTNYNPDEMKKHHNSGKHEYLIAAPVLLADVIINLPKPKTHRKAGITGALKNLVGINGNKDWLPHHKKGAKEEGGDEYLTKNMFKRLESNLQDIINRKLQKRQGIINTQILHFLERGASILGNFTAKDKYYEGSWYGNDTIWRTIADLNRILLYCDKEGKLKKDIQRRIFIVGDMIISGEGEGPLMPTPIHKGTLIFGTNPVAFDTIVAEIMGFDYRKIPSIHYNYKKERYPLINFGRNEIIIKENIKDFNKRQFVPSLGWKGHIEK